MGSMNEKTIKRYSLTEIALLALFVLGLTLSGMLVKARNRIRLSAPVSLKSAGLSVCMPMNTGWESESSWRYESDSSMVLVGQEQSGRARKASIRWRYVICSPAEAAEEIFRQRAAESGSRVGPMKTISGPIPMYYAIVYPAGSDFTFYLGVAALDYGRHLELQVFSYHQFDMSYAENLFLSLAAGIQYTPPESLETGMKLLEQFWQAARVDRTAPIHRDDTLFLLKNTNNQPLGYAYSRASSVRTDSDIRWKLQTHYYEHRLSRIDSTLLFDGSQGRFSWKTTLQQAGAGRPRHYTLTQQAGGIEISADSESDRQLTCDKVLPEVLLPECAALLLENGLDEELTLDVLSATGLVVPTVLEQG